MEETIIGMRERHRKEVKEFQDSCLHPIHKRIPYMWAPGHFGNDVEVCDNCGKILEHYTNSVALNENLWSVELSAVK